MESGTKVQVGRSQRVVARELELSRTTSASTWAKRPPQVEDGDRAPLRPVWDRVAHPVVAS
jgi:hypothetical protein